MNAGNSIRLIGLLLAVALGSAPAQNPPSGQILPKRMASVAEPESSEFNDAGDKSPTASHNTRSSGPVRYHGGPVLLGTPNVYYIWYGDWSSDNTPSILTDLMNSLGGSSYLRITSSYFDSNGQRPSGNVALAGTANDDYSHGRALSDSDVKGIVSESIASGRLPKDANGVYFVLGAEDVNETSGLCVQYCGWHSSSNLLGSDIKYAFIGNPARCPSACEPQTSSPNDNPAADAMASVVVHELSESITDPDLNAWYDRRGMESADKCSWSFGATQTAANGSYYNLTLGARQFLIQQIWVNAFGGYCSLSF